MSFLLQPNRVTGMCTNSFGTVSTTQKEHAEFNL
jgi:hypothetical protein